MSHIYNNIAENKFKTWVLMLAFTAFVLIVAYFISKYLNQDYIFYFAISFAVLSNIFTFWFADKIVLRMHGARIADEENYKQLHKIVENISITAGIPKPKVYIIQDDAPNAFATGRSYKHSAVAVTEGLLNLLDKSELEAVIAHEISHIKNKDTLVMTVAAVLVGFLAIIIDYAWHFSWFNSNRYDDKKSFLHLVLFLFITIFAPIVAQIIQFAISRKREFLADSSAVLLTRYPEALANALIKIDSYNKPSKYASVATAHLYISNPFSKFKSDNLIYKLFSTHPPVEERIKAILSTKY